MVSGRHDYDLSMVSYSAASDIDTASNLPIIRLPIIRLPIIRLPIIRLPIIMLPSLIAAGPSEGSLLPQGPVRAAYCRRAQWGQLIAAGPSLLPQGPVGAAYCRRGPVGAAYCRRAQWGQLIAAGPSEGSLLPQGPVGAAYCRRAQWGKLIAAGPSGGRELLKSCFFLYRGTPFFRGHFLVVYLFHWSCRSPSVERTPPAWGHFSGGSEVAPDQRLYRRRPVLGYIDVSTIIRSRKTTASSFDETHNTGKGD